ncbi:hypothetical protein UlMin_036377 [Ulmus minor]
MDPVLASRWLDNLVLEFNLQDIPKEYCVDFANYLLKDLTQEWWDTMRVAYDVSNIQWQTFEQLFHDYYIPIAYTQLKAKEFYRLEQGDMIVMEYHVKFTKISKYAPGAVANQLEKIAKFEEGSQSSGSSGGSILLVEAYMGHVPLFDMGASHSFIYELFVNTLGLEIQPFYPLLTLRTFMGGYALVFFFFYFIVFPMAQFDVIFGMDWLSKYQTIIDCQQARVIIGTEDGGMVTYQLELVGKHSYITVVNEYPDVFLDELPGLPPKRKIEFRIDLISGTYHVFISPYRMAPTKITELRKQL